MKWWIRRCPHCGEWLEARPAREWWTKREDEEEIELERVCWYGGVRWYIGDTLTRVVNVDHDERCRILAERTEDESNTT